METNHHYTKTKKRYIVSWKLQSHFFDKQPMQNNRENGEWFLETNKLVTNLQCSFQSNHRYINHLVNLKNFIKEFFIRGEHITIVFFDLPSQLGL